MVNQYKPPAPSLTYGQPYQYQPYTMPSANPWWSRNQGNQATSQPVFGGAPPQVSGQTAPAPTTNWGQVPQVQESGSGFATGGSQPWFYARTATPDPHGNLPGSPGYMSPDTSTTTTLAGGKTPTDPSALAGLVTGQARAGLPDDGKPGIGNAPGVASTTPGGQQTTWTQQPEWMDGAYNLGWDYKNGQYTPRNQTLAKGYVVGSDVGWQSGMALPVAYNAAQDTYRGGLNGTETAIHKAMRIANDLVKNGQANSPQRALEYGMAFVQAEAKRAGQSTGWDMNQLKDQLGGYNENVNYFTGQPGNAGVDPTTGAPSPAAGADNTGGGGNGGGAGGGNNGRYDPLAVAAASKDPRLGYDMLRTHLTGSNKAGTGPFAGFLEDFLAPVTTALINAQSTTGGGMGSVNLEQIFNDIKGMTGSNAKGSLFDYLGGKGKEAFKKATGGGDMSFDELSEASQMYGSLLQRTLNPLQQRVFSRQQGDALRGLQQGSYTDMIGNDQGDFGRRYANTGFYKNWWDR